MRWSEKTRPGPWFNKNTSSYQYRKSHYGDKTILRPSYLHNGISHTGKMTSLYWISPLTKAHFTNMVSLTIGHGYVISSIVLCGVLLLIPALTSTAVWIYAVEVRAWMTNYIKWIYVDVITYPCHKPGACLMINNEMIRTDNTGQLAVLQISSKVSHIGLQWQNTEHVYLNRGVVWLKFRCIRVSGYILSDNNSYTIRSVYWWIVCAIIRFD